MLPPRPTDAGAAEAAVEVAAPNPPSVGAADAVAVVDDPNPPKRSHLRRKNPVPGRAKRREDNLLQHRGI